MAPTLCEFCEEYVAAYGVKRQGHCYGCEALNDLDPQNVVICFRFNELKENPDRVAIVCDEFGITEERLNEILYGYPLNDGEF